MESSKSTGGIIASCGHDDVTFLHEDNDFVCLQCGLVLRDFAFMDRASTSILGHEVLPQRWTQLANNATLPTDLSMYASADAIGVQACAKKESQWNLDILERVCENFFIPRSVEDRVVSLLSQREYREKRNGREDRDLTLISVALYFSCLSEDCAKTPEVITSWFQVNEKSFWAMADQFSYTSRKLLPSDILTMLKSEVELLHEDLCYSKMNKIALISNRLTHKLSHSPRVILAAVLYLYLCEYCRGKRVSVREIANACNVSITSVNQLKKLLKSMNIFEIESEGGGAMPSCQ